MTKLKKIVSIVTTFTFLFGMAMPAAALTADELQTQITALMAQLATLQTQLSILQGDTGTTIAGCTITSFDRALKVGMTGDDVKCLQIVLNSDSATLLASSGVGSSGSETTYFGPLTKAGVIKFQEKYASEVLASWGLTSGTGFVGSTTRTKLNSILSTGVTDVTDGVSDVTPPSSGLAVSLASDTPVAMAVALGSNNKIFAKLNFAAGETVTITKIIIHRSGVSNDDDIDEVKIYEGATQLGSTQALNTITHKSTFSGLSWAFSAGEVKVLTIKGSIATNASTGDSIKLGIALNADITTSEGVTVAGLPIYSNALSVAGSSVGVLDIQENDNSIEGTVISGSTDQKVGSFKFTASAVEGFDVQEIVLTEIGTSVDSDISNITLKYLGTTLGTTVASLTDGQAVFTGSPLFDLRAGISKDIDIYVDIASEVISERTVRFEITEHADVTAIGQNTGGAVQVTVSSAAYTVQQSSEWTVKQGTLTVALDGATDPSETKYVVGGTQDKITSLKFSAGAREGIKITKLKLTKITAAISGQIISDNEFQNVQLYAVTDGVVGASLGYVGGVSSGIVTFTDADGLFTVPKSGNTVIMVKADFTTAADANDELGFFIGAVTHVEMKGVDSDAKIQSDSDHITFSAINETSEATVHTVVAEGNLTISNSPDTPASQSITVGQDDFEIFRFRLAAEYEDMRIASVKVRFFNDSTVVAIGTNNVETTSTDYLSNVQLFDGTTLLDELSSPQAGSATFSTNFTVAKNETKTLKVVADIPTGSNLLYLGASVGAKTTDITDAAVELTTTGVNSSQNIDETGYAISSNFTFQIPTLAVAAASTPPAQYVVTNATEQWIARLQLTNTYEDTKITRIIITFDDNALLDGGSSAEDVFNNVILKVGTTKIGTTKNITDAGGNNSKDIVTFDGINNLTISKDQTISLDVYADATATSSDTENLTWYVGHSSNTDIIGTGVYSNTTVNSTGDAQPGNYTLVRSSGLITVAVDANTPIATNHSVGIYGKTGVEFSKYKFEATYESMKITNLKLTLTDANAGAGATTTAGSYDFNTVYLYDGTTQLASAPVVGSTANFVNEIGLFTVPSAGYKVITVKADVFGIGTGAIPGDAPKLYISDLADTTMLRALGSSSNSSTTVTLTTGGVDPTTPGNQLSQYLYKSIATIAKNASSPAGASVAGAAKEVLRFDVTADSTADIVVNTVALTISGTVDITGTGNASLYKSTDLVNALATEAYKTVTLVGGGTVTTATTSKGGWDGIPTGATVHILDACGASTFRTATVKSISDESATGVSTLTFDSAVDADITDCVRYQPLQQGSGKLFFGGMQYLNADTAVDDTTVTLDSTDGFASGDTVILKGYDSSGNATQTAALTVATTTETVLHFDSALLVVFDYNYNTVQATADTIADRAYAYTDTTTATNNIEEAVSAGTTKTFIVKGDTTGAGTTESLQVSIAAVGDFVWDDKYLGMINARTTDLPLDGGTLTY